MRKKSDDDNSVLSHRLQATDIFIMAIYYSVRIPDVNELWMQKGYI